MQRKSMWEIQNFNKASKELLYENNKRTENPIWLKNIENSISNFKNKKVRTRSLKFNSRPVIT